MLKRFKRLSPIRQTIFTFLIGLSVVAFWRGAWGLMDVYIFPDNYLLSSLLSIFIGFFILYATNYWTKEFS